MRTFLLLSLIFYSCSNYKLTRRVNPFKKYGISSVSVPMFYNQSNLSDVSHHFTRYFTKELYDLKGLEVKSSLSENVDAYLVGIIVSPGRLMETLVPDGMVEARSVAAQSVANRSTLIPTTTRVRMSLNIYLIRKTSNSKAIVFQLRQKNFPELMEKHDSIVFKESIPITASIAREIFDGKNVVINDTQNRGILEKTIIREAKEAAQRFKNTILYAF